jgi:hypothetical protein
MDLGSVVYSSLPNVLLVPLNHASLKICIAARHVAFQTTPFFLNFDFFGEVVGCTHSMVVGLLLSSPNPTPPSETLQFLRFVFVFQISFAFATAEKIVFDLIAASL